MNFITTLIQAIHLVFIAFVVFTPFSSNPILLHLYLVVIPFMVLHWVVNNDTCALTILESLVTGKPAKETFVGRIVMPVFQISSWQIYIITGILYAIAIKSCYKNKWEIQHPQKPSAPNTTTR